MKMSFSEKLKSQYKTPAAKIGLTVLVLVLLACIGLMVFSPKPSIIIENGFLTINSLFYGRTIPIEDINADGIRLLNLKTDNDYKPRIRTNGIGLPNYTVGWMRLRNGNKALVYLNDRTNVVLIPTKEFDVLISTNDIDWIKELMR